MAGSARPQFPLLPVSPIIAPVMARVIDAAVAPVAPLRPRAATTLAAAILALAALAVPSPALAVPAGRIEGLQMPVWVERHGATRPGWAGMRLHSGDRVRTGEGARVLLRLDEGSHVRLGAGAQFVLSALEAPPEPGGRFRGLLDIVEGAFRFTTTALSRGRARDLDIRIAGVTAGIRGTDVWGKTAPDRDIVCLIEGEVTVRRGEESPVQMRDPLTFYVAPRGAPAEPVRPVSASQLAEWAAEVALSSGGGITRPRGGWQVHVSSHETRASALAALARLEADGYAARLTSVDIDGRTWHRLSIGSLSGPEEARALAETLAARPDVTTPWVAADDEG